MEACCHQLGCSTTVLTRGLSTAEATERWQRYGPNQLSEKQRVTVWQRLGQQLANVLVILLIIVAIIAIVRAVTSTSSQTIITNWIQAALIILVIVYVCVACSWRLVILWLLLLFFCVCAGFFSQRNNNNTRQYPVTTTTASFKLTHSVRLVLFVDRINTIIGILQEGSAEKATHALNALLSPDAVVVRDGNDIQIPADQLVPGDLVKLHLGDRVPADLRLVTVGNLSVQEAALTGESVPVDKSPEDLILVPTKHAAVSSSSSGSAGAGEEEEKEEAEEKHADPWSIPVGDRSNMCFSATLVSQGSGTGLVVATGDDTEIGTINVLVNKVAKKKTAVLEQIDTISLYLAFVITLAGIVTWCIAFFLTKTNAVDALSLALVCAVAMIPAGLVAIVTMTYAWAVSNMAKRNAILRILPAVETLGSVTVICSDKTGTLTQNIMSLTVFVTSNQRLRFDVNATERTNTNFVVDNNYLAARADHAKFGKASDLIKTGPSSSRRSRRDKGTFPFGMNLGFGKTAHGGVEPDEPQPITVDDYPDAEGDNPDVATHMPTGESPSSDYLRLVLAGGILCSKCVLGENGTRQGEIGSPTELAILRAAYFGNVNVSEVKDSASFLTEVPFSSEYKFMATVHEPVAENDTEYYMDELIVHVKGAPDRLLPLCKYQAKGGLFAPEDLEPCNMPFWIEQVAILSSHGLRVLALTRSTVPKESVAKGQQVGPDFVLERAGGPWLTMVGLCAIMDPPRAECVQAVAEAHEAGVRIAMITGDHRDTALAIAGMLGLVDKKHPDAITGPELDAMTEEEVKVAVQRYNVFARASPQNKLRIVKALQAVGEVAGMTGDGVNDAPALKAADMGVAMGKEGTDVAREAAEMILADDNFATIIFAVREGRVVWDNLRKVLLVNTPLNLAQGMSVLFGLLLGLPTSPLSPIQVLYCNLICAITLCLVPAIEPAEEGIMQQPPRKVGKRLIGRLLCLRIAIATMVLVACTVGSVFWADSLGYSLGMTRSQALNALSFGSVAITASARFSRKSAFSPRSFYGNNLAWWSYSIVVVLQVFITYTPGLNQIVFTQSGMTGIQWGIVILFMVVVFVIMEFEKAVREFVADRDYYADDREEQPFDAMTEPPADTNVPDKVSRFGRNELPR